MYTGTEDSLTTKRIPGVVGKVSSEAHVENLLVTILSSSQEK